MPGLGIEVLHRDSCVLSACTGSFTGAGPQLAIGKPNSVEIWAVDAESQLQLATTVALQSTLERVLTLSREAPGQLDWLLTITSEDSCSVLQCQTGESQEQQHQWETNTVKVEVPGDTAAHRIDQTACSSAVYRSSGDVQYVQWALAVYEGVIHVLRATLRNGQLEALGTKAFWTGAALQLTVDFTMFLAESRRYHDPTVCTVTVMPCHMSCMQLWGRCCYQTLT